MKSSEPKVIYEMTDSNLKELISEVRVQVREEMSSALKLASEKPIPSIRMCAQFLGVHPSTVKKLIRDNQIPHHRIANTKSILFFASELVTHIKARNR